MNDKNSRHDLIFCIENEDFREYLKSSCQSSGHHALFLAVENIPRIISENTEATLILQSEKNESIFFDIGRKLKGFFFKDLFL